MRYNGELQYLIHEGDELNEFGELIAGESSWSEPLKCSVNTRADRKNYQKQDGQFRVASFDILLPLDSQFPWNERTRLKVWRDSEYLGEYDIINSELATSTGRQKITI